MAAGRGTRLMPLTKKIPMVSTSIFARNLLSRYNFTCPDFGLHDKKEQNREVHF